MPTVAFDFDGVVHQYVSGWESYEVVLDPPIKSTVRAIEKLRKLGYKVVIFSARSRHPNGNKAMLDWLEKYGIEVDEVCSDKPLAQIYFDDRAVQFVPGMDIVSTVRKFRPWNKDHGNMF